VVLGILLSGKAKVSTSFVLTKFLNENYTYIQRKQTKQVNIKIKILHIVKMPYVNLVFK